MLHRSHAAPTPPRGRPGARPRGPRRVHGWRPDTGSADPAPASSSGRELPGRPAAPPPRIYDGPPADGPPSAGPLTTLRAAVDLTPAIPGFFSRAETAVPAPDGGAYVVVTPEQAGAEPQLVTVAGGTFTIARSVPIPGIAGRLGDAPAARRHPRDHRPAAVCGRAARRLRVPRRRPGHGRGPDDVLSLRPGRRVLVRALGPGPGRPHAVPVPLRRHAGDDPGAARRRRPRQRRRPRTNATSRATSRPCPGRRRPARWRAWWRGRAAV